MKILTQDDIQRNTQLLIQASEKGDIDKVKRLLPVSDPKVHNSAALRIAAYNGHVDIVKLLIPVSDPKVKNSEALLWAAKHGQIEIVEMLIPVSDYLKAEQDMIQYSYDTTLLRQYINEHEALLQKERLTHQLNSNLDHIQNSSVKRKM